MMLRRSGAGDIGVTVSFSFTDIKCRSLNTHWTVIHGHPTLPHNTNPVPSRMSLCQPQGAAGESRGQRGRKFAWLPGFFDKCPGGMRRMGALHRRSTIGQGWCPRGEAVLCEEITASQDEAMVPGGALLLEA